MQIRYLVNNKPVTSWIDLDLFEINDVEKMANMFNKNKNWQVEYREVK